MSIVTRRALFGAAVAAALAFAAPAQARELRIAPGVPPAHPAWHSLYQKLAEYLPAESGGALTATIVGPEVVRLPQVKDALQTGLVDIGNLLPLYFPAELPNMALAGELALSGRDALTMAAAITEYTVTCPACQDEMKRLGMVYLGSGSSDVYHVLSTRPVASLADIRGLRLRSGGAPFSRWAEHFGAVPMQIPVGETFESISQGVIDGTIASVGDLLSFRLIDLVTHVYMVPVGTYHATVNFAVALPVWESLSTDERAALVRAANRANVDFTYNWGVVTREKALDAAREAGIRLVEPLPEDVAASDAFAEADRANAVRIAEERFGMTDAARRVERFLALVGRWKAIVAEAAGDPEALKARLQEEVWSKIDPASYGL